MSYKLISLLFNYQGGINQVHMALIGHVDNILIGLECQSGQHGY